ncbi:unnamed protein product, partial [Amoebophrya sp. A120]
DHPPAHVRFQASALHYCYNPQLQYRMYHSIPAVLSTPWYRRNYHNYNGRVVGDNADEITARDRVENEIKADEITARDRVENEIKAGIVG